ncbi:hypothetical protein BDF19DRAFT_445502 [Syncephalis fuscata]|nr:hypothetical protein BDF19DRAFT_445502 [Syncephalis fuscata]
MSRMLLLLTVMALLASSSVAHQSMRRPVELAIKSVTSPAEDETLMGATENCLAALNSDEVSSTCLSELAETPENDTLLLEMCTALNKKSGSYRCSKENAEKALDILESQCATELSNGHPQARALYSRWYLYPLSADVICSTNDDGSLCNYGPQSDSMLDANWECLKCIRKQIRLVDNWTPTRKAGPAIKAYDRWWFANNDVKHHCGMNGGGRD